MLSSGYGPDEKTVSLFRCGQGGSRTRYHAI